MPLTHLSGGQTNRQIQYLSLPENRKCKGPEAGACLTHLRNSKVQTERSKNEVGNRDCKAGGKGKNEESQTRDEILH